jgi:hypothetical protein
MATTMLADHLQKGTLVLFLGAGVSVGLGLPNWVDFVNSIRTKAGLPQISPTINADQLQIAADEVRAVVQNINDYHLLLRDALYVNIANLSSDVLANKLLISIGALLMGSKRGSVQRVVTLNYDSMIEWYLSLYGFVVRVVDKLPDLEGGEDVRVYHVHGFLPHSNMRGYQNSDEIILGFESVNKRIGTPGDLWVDMLRHIISNGMCLFVGMSENTFNDRALAPLFTTIGAHVSAVRPTGVYVLTGNRNSTVEQHYLRNNMVPLYVNNYDDIPDYLLGICREAAGRI